MHRSASSIISFIFFGNYFYGACAIGLCIEASLQQQYPLNGVLFYLLVFFATVVYYTKAYLYEGIADPNNRRSVWYSRNRSLVFGSQVLFTIAFIVCAVLYLPVIWPSVLSATATDWLALVLFPSAAAMYYGLPGRYNLRRVGWLKPFIIGFSWAGLVTVYPVLFYCLSQKIAYRPELFNLLLFIKNFMFISLLCILFDIKDYATDYNQRLKTFVVEVGLRKTIFYIIIPLSVLGLGTFLTYGITHGFSMMKIVLNTIPFLALLYVAYSLQRRRPILYYLIVIDGLMLLKALCGSIAMLLF